MDHTTAAAGSGSPCCCCRSASAAVRCVSCSGEGHVQACWKQGLGRGPPAVPLEHCNSAGTSGAFPTLRLIGLGSWLEIGEGSACGIGFWQVTGSVHGFHIVPAGCRIDSVVVGGSVVKVAYACSSLCCAPHDICTFTPAPLALTHCCCSAAAASPAQARQQVRHGKLMKLN